MLTFFTVPKAFVGRTAVLQMNALESWRAAAEAAEIILFGDEAGVAQAAADVGARHERRLERTEGGAPRVDDVFARAQALSAGGELCFVNADVMLPSDLSVTLAELRAELPRAILVGQCRNLDVTARTGWTATLARVASESPLRGPGGIDYVLFAQGAFVDIPPFALGRAYFDNWLIWDAVRRGKRVIDLTERVLAVHQNHDYGHVAGGRDAVYAGADAQRNLALAGGRLHLFNIDDATHRLTQNGLRRNALAPLRAFAPARRLALQAGVVERAVVGRFRRP